MNVGVTGHQYRPSIDWSWVAKSVRAELSKLARVKQISCSLASGSDQIAAEIAIALKIHVIAVIPLEGYEKYFSGDDLAKYRRLLPQCEPKNLSLKGDPERAFFEAGKFIVDSCETLLAIWDGEAAEGLGGTGDIVEYAKRHVQQLIHINPIRQTITHL